MKALVLAAGKGERLAAVGSELPKPLMDVGGTTPLRLALEWLVPLLPQRIWVNVHRQADLVRSRIGDTIHGIPISYSFERVLLGTAGAWKELEAEWTETSVVVYGDNVLRFDARALLDAHRGSGALVTIAVYDPDRAVHTGIAGGRARLVRDRVEAFVEGGESGMINAGVYCIEPGLRERLEPGFADFGRDVLPELARRGELGAHVLEDGAWCIGIDTPDRLERARALLGTGVEALK